MDVEVFDVDLEAAGTDLSGKEFGEAGCPVPPACASDGDAAGAGGQGRVVGEVGEQLAGAGRVEETSWTRGLRPSRSRMSRAAAGSRSRSRTSSMRSAAGGTGKPSGPVGRCR